MKKQSNSPILRLIIASVFLWIGLLGAVGARAEIKLPHILSDHAVLQRNRPIHIWGTANPGSSIVVRFHAQSATAAADVTGAWSVWLSPEREGGPFSLAIQGDGVVTLNDILVGDVWIASGQSNMQMPLKGFDKTPVNDSTAIIAAATNPKIRLLNISRRTSKVPASDINEQWVQCTPKSVPNISAIGYLFAHEISQREKVPIGLIVSTWGGTPVEAWTSEETMKSNPALQGPELRADPIWQPSGVYNAMIAPLTPYSVKGILWYQGESNSSPLARARDYRVQFPALIADWRMHFAQGRIPFLFVQISSFMGAHESWGLIRDAQRRTLDVADTAMAVSLDVGVRDNVHPPDKQTVATRLSLAARALVYREPVEYQAPLFRQATTEGGAMRVWLDHSQGIINKASAIEGFEVAGEDHRFQKASARIDRGTIVVTAPSVPNPKYVRYAWANDAVPSLYNAATLPLSTFTSEEHPEQYQEVVVTQ
ncbi:MAG: sialate O-acetylesterase [Acidobacteriaceae bacterium]|nr:sialate O-acetylesterase [Acidobacteriaceae bacterium]